MIKEAIYKLINHEDLTYEESLAVMGEMMDGTATQAQMGGFLTALRMQGETIDEITAFATVMREKGVKLHPERDVMEILPNGKLIDKITSYDEYLASDEMAKKRQVYSTEGTLEDN